jgi:hypothetical protein
MFMVDHLLIKQICGEKLSQPSKPSWTHLWGDWHPEQPQAGPSGQVPEALSIQEVGAPCMLLPLKTLHWGVMWRWKAVTLMISILCRPTSFMERPYSGIPFLSFTPYFYCNFTMSRCSDTQILAILLWLPW